MDNEIRTNQIRLALSQRWPDVFSPISSRELRRLVKVGSSRVKMVPRAPSVPGAGQ